MHISALSELSNLHAPRSRGRKYEPYPLLRRGREDLNALRGLGIDGSLPPEAVAAIKRALQWLACAQDTKRPDERLECLQKAETALDGASMSFKAMLWSVPE